MGEKISQRKKTLWMRYVSFYKVKDILHLVNKNNGRLRAGELEKLAEKEGILIKENGKPFSHSPRYHYRKAMENLGLLTLQNKVYYVSQNTKAKRLLQKTEFKKLLSPEAEEVIREIIVNNKDCRRYFFDIFMDNSYNNLQSLRKKGKAIIVETKGKEGIILNNLHTGQIIFLNNPDKINAIFWGVRLWALELKVIDEIFISYKEGRFIYPINTYESSSEVFNLIIESIKADKGDSEWVTIHIPSFIKEVVLSLRLPIEEVKKALWEIRKNNPSIVMLIPTSKSFINIKTPYQKQDYILLKPYIVDMQGRYISHIKINKDIVNVVHGGT